MGYLYKNNLYFCKSDGQIYVDGLAKYRQ